jgi:uncharacterized protein YdhG (YjbR/CyaY superfamily)
MRSELPVAKTIDEYIERCPSDVQGKLEKIRKTILKAIPGSEEGISYQIPVFKWQGKVVIYFAAFKNHISVYPAPRGSKEFKEELAAYEGGKGTVQFPLDRPIPMDLIKRIAKFRLLETMEKAAAKGKRKA